MGGSAYQDWTAQVEKTPGILVLMYRPREVPVPSLMINEEVNKGAGAGGPADRSLPGGQ